MEYLVNSGGNVGINTTSPQALLHINTSANINPFRITSPSSAQTFIVDSSGSAGINTTSPTASLEVAGTLNVTQSSTSLRVTSNGDVVIRLG